MRLIQRGFTAADADLAALRASLRASLIGRSILGRNESIRMGPLAGLLQQALTLGRYVFPPRVNSRHSKTPSAGQERGATPHCTWHFACTTYTLLRCAVGAQRLEADVRLGESSHQRTRRVVPQQRRCDGATGPIFSHRNCECGCCVDNAADAAATSSPASLGVKFTKNTRGAFPGRRLGGRNKRLLCVLALLASAGTGRDRVSRDR